MKREYFNGLAERWDSLPSPPGAGAAVAEFCRRACPPPARLVLDVGAGTGLLAPYLLEKAEDRHLIELDFALEMLVTSSRKRQAAQLYRVCSDATVLPFAPDQFDAVLCFGVLPHLGDPAGALLEFRRVLRPGGTLAVGHLLGSRELNDLHHSLGGPVAGDTLPPAASLADTLRRLDFSVADAVEEPGGYFVRALKERE